MVWQPLNFDWNNARAFLVTAEEGSLSAAARALGMAQPTLGRQVSALEREMGVTLFERVGRGLTLTLAGKELLRHVRAMGESAGDFALTASGQSQTLEGSVTVTASEVISAFLLPSSLQRIRQLYPRLQLKVVASNTVQDIRRREADIAIRSGRPSDPELIATRLDDTPARLYASASYFERHGRPQSIAEGRDAQFIGLADNERYMAGLNAMGFTLTEKNFALLSDSHLVHWELVKAGLGIGVIIDAIGDAEPKVERVFPALEPIAVPAWLVTHRELLTSRRVRVVFDALVEHFGRRAQSKLPMAAQ